MKTKILSVLLTVMSFYLGFSQPGSLDPDFGEYGKVLTNIGLSLNEGNSVVLQPDGKFLVAGISKGGNNTQNIALTRFHPDGTLDLSFGDKGTVATIGYRYGNHALALQPDGKMLLGGSQNRFPFLKRYHPDGSIDQSFGTDGIAYINIDTTNYNSGSVHAIKVMPDGKILAGGDYDYWGNVLARFNSDGSPDDSFGVNGFIQNYTGYIEDIATAQDGKILAFGSYSTADWQRNLICRRYHPDGSLDDSFGNEGQITLDVYPDDELTSAKSLAILSDGKILMLSSSYNKASFKTEMVLWRCDAGGVPDPTFGVYGVLVNHLYLSVSTYAEAMVIQPDGTILIAGAYSSDFFICKLHPNGENYTSFGNNNGFTNTGFETTPGMFTYESAKSIAVYPNGKIIAVGSIELGFSEEYTHIAIAKYSSQGFLDASFDNDGKMTINGLVGGFDEGKAMTLQSDGKILMTGTSFNHNTGRYDKSLARYHNNGELDESFAINGTAHWSTFSYDFGKSVVQQPDEKIIVASIPSGSLILNRLLPNGVIDSTFGVNGATSIYGDLTGVFAGMALQPDGKILVGIERTIYPSTNSSFSLVRFLPNGALDSLFGTLGLVSLSINQQNSTCTALALQPDGKIILAGYYEHGPWREDVALMRFNPDGTLDPSFGTNGVTVKYTPGANRDLVKDIAILPDGKILLAANIIDNTDSIFWAVFRFTADGSLDNTFNGNGWTTFVWETEGPVNEVNSIAIQQNGKILLGGSTGDFALARLDAEGTLDPTFGNEGKVTLEFDVDDSYPDVITDMILLDGGKLIAGGHAWNGLDEDFAVARFLLGPDVGTIDFSAMLPQAFIYPNPIPSQTTLSYQLSQNDRINMTLYNVEGKVVHTFFDKEYRAAGIHKESLDFSGIAPGSYFLTIDNGKGKCTIKLVKQN